MQAHDWWLLWLSKGAKPLPSQLVLVQPCMHHIWGLPASCMGRVKRRGVRAQPKPIHAFLDRTYVPTTSYCVPAAPRAARHTSSARSRAGPRDGRHDRPTMSAAAAPGRTVSPPHVRAFAVRHAVLILTCGQVLIKCERWDSRLIWTSGRPRFRHPYARYTAADRARGGWASFIVWSIISFIGWINLPIQNSTIYICQCFPLTTNQWIVFLAMTFQPSEQVE